MLGGNRGSIASVRYHRRATHPTPLSPLDRQALLASILSERQADRLRRRPEPPEERDATGWPKCRHCRQSCTGSYLDRAHCVRCDTYHRLTLDVA